MSQVVVSASSLQQSLVVKATLTVHLACLIGNAFTSDFDEDLPLHGLLKDLFGRHRFRWYCVDQSSPIYQITFSNAANPRILQYQGAPAAIAIMDRESFSLRMHEADMVRPGRLNPARKHPHAILHP